jgi:tRNA (cmo5U34)-methyltransferase
MTDAVAAFDEHADGYDELRRRLIPPYDAFYAAAVDAIRITDGLPVRVLDLGAGTGLLAQRVAAAFPDANLTLLDGASSMLEMARRALGDRPHYVEADLTAPLPPGPWDVVVSALAIHHIDDAAKHVLFKRVHAGLLPGGAFVNAEHVGAPTPLFQARYAAWHEQRAKASGATVEEWRAARERMRFDEYASVEDQLRWLREAGFADADCLFKDHCFAVLVARRAPE